MSAHVPLLMICYGTRQEIYLKVSEVSTTCQVSHTLTQTHTEYNAVNLGNNLIDLKYWICLLSSPSSRWVLEVR